jgi:uncharacterized delta-60 repeat protein
MPENSAPTFTSIGKIITAVGPTESKATDVVIQADGKILVAGYSDNADLNDYDYAVLRYNSDGSLDTSFGIDGMAITPIGASDDYAKSIALQADGKILLAGEIWDGEKWIFSLVRYNGDGSLDNNFGAQGIVTTPVNAAEYGNSVAIQADGKILLAGSSWDGTTWNFVAARYNGDGSLDTSFSDDGTVTINMGAYGSAGYNVLVQADSKILLTGVSDFHGTAMVRLNADGSLDSSYGSDGKVITDFQWGLSSTLLADGTLLVAGYLLNENTDFAVAKYHSDGSLDTSFGVNGIAAYDIGGFEAAISIAVQPDGKILLCGSSDVYRSSGNAVDFAVMRLNTDGSLDTTFDGDGHLTTALGAYNDASTDIAVQDDGRIVVVGQANLKFALARYNPDGSLDETFAATNTLDHSPTYTENGAPILLDGQVSIYDAELAALGDGAGNYGGATLTLNRSGGPNADDHFSATGDLHFSDGFVWLTGAGVPGISVTIGTYSNGDGTLQIVFNQNATQAWVNETLSSITYANSSDHSPASIQIEWVFSDGNSGAQGSGGVLAATGSTIVNIAPLNDLPQLTGSQTPLPNGDIGMAYTVSAQNLLSGYSDVDGDSLAVANLVADYANVIDNGDGSYSITPHSLHYRLIGLRYDVVDGHGGSTAASHSFSLSSIVNTAPALTGTQGLLASGQEDTPYVLAASSLLAGYTDTEGDILGIAELTADYGSVTNNGDGTYTITPTTNHTGAVVLHYDVIDHNGGSIAGNQTLQLVSANDAPSFVAGGVAVTSFGYHSMSNALAIEPDGQLLLAGVVTPTVSTGYFATLRYNADGSLDDSFIYNFMGSDANTSIASSVAVQPDGKIVVAGLLATGIDGAGLIRYNPDGTPDEGFGEGGIVISETIQGGNVTALLQPDGKILLAGGFGFLGAPYKVVRYNNDGSLDTSFDADGVASTMIGTFGGVENALLQPDGKILLVGSCFYNATRDFFLVRFNVDGSLDSSFSVDGKLTTAIGSMDDYAYDAVLQADGKILVVGQSNFDFALVRYNPDGTLDTSFGEDGKVTTDFGLEDTAYSAAIQADGKIVVAGDSDYSSDLSDAVLARYNPDGTLDTSFGNAGTSFVNWGDGSSQASSVSIQADGKIVVAGSTTDDFVLARFNPDGSLDNTLNPYGTLDGVANYTENSTATVLDANVQVYDAELYQNGSLAGATLTLLRHGGANAEDVFSGSGNLALVSGNAKLYGIAIGSLASIPGTITITFNDKATPALVNELLSSIAYANTSDSPPASVQIDWIFQDGMGGSVTGFTTVDITPITEAPTLTGSQAELTAGSEDTAYHLNASNLLTGFTDADGDSLSVIELSADHGSVLDNGNGTYIITPMSNYFGTVNLSYVVTDGNGGNTQAMQSFTLAAANDMPALSNAMDDLDAPIGLAFSFQIPSNTFTDADPGDGLSYTATLADGSTLPIWIRFNATTLTFSGTPDSGDIGTWTVRITATDTAAAATTGYFDIVVDKLRLHGTTGNDMLQGTSESDMLFGQAGSDILQGLRGDDELDGGIGSDTIIGDIGNDIFFVDDAGVVVIELPKQGNDSVFSSVSHTLANNVENLNLSGSSNIDAYGNQGKNVISGNSGDNLLDGGASGDMLVGGLGDDSYVIDNKKDVIFEEFGQGHETVYSSISLTMGANIEDLILSGKASYGIGNALDNNIIGNAANNKLEGGEGNDTLQGGAGKDKLTGGAGSDIFIFDNLAGVDVLIDFQPGQDQILLDSLIFGSSGPSEQLDAAAFASGAKLGTAIDADDRIIYDSSSGKIYYDADGTGAAYASIQFATLSNPAGISLSATDFWLT